MSAETLVRLADYMPPVWSVDAVELRFELFSAETLVHAQLSIQRSADRQREPLCWPLQRKTAGRGAGAAPTTAFLPCYAAPVPPRGRGYCASSKGRLWTRGSAIKCALCGQELWEGAVLSGRETCETEAYLPAETYPCPSIRLGGPP